MLRVSCSLRSGGSYASTSSSSDAAFRYAPSLCARQARCGRRQLLPLLHAVAPPQGFVQDSGVEPPSSSRQQGLEDYPENAEEDDGEDGFVDLEGDEFFADEATVRAMAEAAAAEEEYDPSIHIIEPRK